MAALSLLLAGALLTSVTFFSERSNAQSKVNENAPAHRENILKTLIAGLKNREQNFDAKSISGIAEERNWFGDSYWGSLDSVGDLKAQRLQGTYADRDMMLVRFNLSKNQWYYEVQCLLWAGAGRWFRRDYQRKATEVRDLYHRSLYDGKNIYHYGEYIQSKPSGFIETADKIMPGMDQRFFRLWLGLGIDEPFSQMLTGLYQEKGMLRELKQEKANDQEVYLLTYVFDNKDFLTESRLWIAPELDFAVVKRHLLRINKKNPKQGSRSIIEWSDFKKVSNVMVPHRVLEQNLHYWEGQSDKDCLESIHEVSLQDIKVEDKFTFDLSDLIIRVGAVSQPNLMGINSKKVDLEKASTEYNRLKAPWARASAFQIAPRPKVAASYAQPLSGQELKALSEKYSLALP
jgi:hypothetical protein